MCSGGGWWIMWIHMCDKNMDVHSSLCVVGQFMSRRFFFIARFMSEIS
jgi:hypothetical protein